MSCVVGIEDPGGAWVGGDSAAVDDDDVLTLCAQPKVFSMLEDEFAVGVVDSSRPGQLVRYSLALPDAARRQHDYQRDPDRFIATSFVEAMRKCLKRGGYAGKGEDEEELGGHFLVAWRARLYRIESDYSFGRSSLGYDAIGAGAAVALGALHATQGQAPVRRIEIALAAAAEHTATVRPPFVVAHAHDATARP
jgi:hypothetical protein